ncbi:hypothetical protein PVAP13_5NG455000 [Panicum virgatum]|uniref:Uncharacterized protein n=1 Tax=Panicum virgatum TaxID=38727 RepID=A0A8T0RYB6_PANVG|nr:hypothetical protein PVAP13_5NG455000 [Panicum virgatum]
MSASWLWRGAGCSCMRSWPPSPSVSPASSMGLVLHRRHPAFVMDPHVGSSSLHDGAQLGSLFLLVPPELVDDSTDELTINIRIDKIKCVVHH